MVLTNLVNIVWSIASENVRTFDVSMYILM